MKREELIKSPEYWLAKIQIDLFNKVNMYMEENNLNRTKLAEKLGVTKGYISQILNGNADHRLSKFVELSLAIGLVPHLQFEKIEDEVVSDSIDELIRKYIEIEKSKKVLLDNGYMITPLPTALFSNHQTDYDLNNADLSFNQEANCKVDDLCA